MTHESSVVLRSLFIVAGQLSLTLSMHRPPQMKTQISIESKTTVEFFQEQRTLKHKILLLVKFSFWAFLFQTIPANGLHSSSSPVQERLK